MIDLHGIAYVSTATAAMTVAELEALLLEIRQLNEVHAITGVLLYSDGNFMQYIEGPAQPLQAAYARIGASRRHTDIIEIFNRPVRARTFSGWHMGFAQPARSELMALSTAQWQTATDEISDADASAPGLLLLKGFWERALR